MSITWAACNNLNDKWINKVDAEIKYKNNLEISLECNTKWDLNGIKENYYFISHVVQLYRINLWSCLIDYNINVNMYKGESDKRGWVQWRIQTLR